MTEYPAPVADIMDAESVRTELAEVEARAEKLRAVLAVLEGEAAPLPAARPAAARSLTSRQVEVLRRIGNGKPNDAIAAELGISKLTVRTHVSAILKTLGLNNRTEAALWWRENGEAAQ